MYKKNDRETGNPEHCCAPALRNVHYYNGFIYDSVNPQFLTTKGGHCTVPAFACSYGYSSALTTVTVHCAVNPPQSAVRVVVP